MLASASAPAASNKKVTYAEEPLELTESDLWEEDTADTHGAGGTLQASSSARSLGFDHSSDSEDDSEPPSPDIKAFHGESHAQQSDQGNQESQGPSQFSSARHSTDSTSRQSFDNASAMPIAASVASHRTRRPPLRANSTFANRDGFGRPRAAIKMGSSAPINIPLMSRLEFRDSDEEDNKKPAPFVPPHLVSNSNDPVMQQQLSIFTGESLGASVKREKLQQRNAILRRTGFLEGPPRVKGMADVLDPIKESHLEKEGMQSSSALTAALGTSPSVGGIE